MIARYHARPLRSARELGGVVSLLTATALSCGPPREPSTPPEEPPPPEPSVPQTALLDASRSLPVAFGPIETTEHYGERLVGELRMSEPARIPYLAGRPLPEGTRLALLLSAAGVAPEAEPDRVLWMEKLDGQWTFQAEARESAAPGANDGCSRCHAEAPRDYVFRIPPPAGNALGG